jgi:hypothetical protein
MQARAICSLVLCQIRQYQTQAEEPLWATACLLESWRLQNDATPSCIDGSRRSLAEATTSVGICIAESNASDTWPVCSSRRRKSTACAGAYGDNSKVGIGSAASKARGLPGLSPRGEGASDPDLMSIIARRLRVEVSSVRLTSVNSGNRIACSAGASGVGNEQQLRLVDNMDIVRQHSIQACCHESVCITDI